MFGHHYFTLEPHIIKKTEGAVSFLYMMQTMFEGTLQTSTTLITQLIALCSIVYANSA
jgi:hypothetical protein